MIMLSTGLSQSYRVESLDRSCLKHSASLKVRYPVRGPWTYETICLPRLAPTSMCFRRASQIRSIVVTSRAGPFSHRHVSDVELATMIAMPVCKLRDLVSASGRAMSMLLKCIQSIY